MNVRLWSVEMIDIIRTNNPHCDGKVIDACSIFGMMDTTGKSFSGGDIIKAIANMHFRGNGLGGGFAVYGLYPEYADYYALHIMYLSDEGKTEVEAFLKQHFRIVAVEEVPTKPIPVIVNAPIVWRYFVEVIPGNGSKHSDDDYVVETGMKINIDIKEAFVFS